MMTNTRTNLLLTLLLLTQGACSIFGDSPLSPGISVMPSVWVETGTAEQIALSQDWWRGFASNELARLIDAAQTANPDMLIASERVRQAEAQARIAGASLFPALNFSINSGRSEMRPQGGQRSGQNASSGALAASYEIDLWGGLAAGRRSAEASLRASRFDQETVRLTLVAGVANGYFQVLSLRGRLLVARQNLATAERLFKLVESRVRYGAASDLDLARQQAAVLSSRATIPTLELQERQTLYALAILAGKTPENFEIMGSDLTGIIVPNVAPGLPTELIIRRPDLASAEAQLAAAKANVTAARTALLPNISLTGSAGLASKVLINFLNAPTAIFSLGASLLQPIFDGGRLRGQVDVASSLERQLVENYRKAILTALADVEGSLAAGSRLAEQEALQVQALEQSRIALRLAEIRYREGIDDLLPVLDAQRTLFQAEDQLAQVRLLRLQASISLFKALGGGWR